MKSSPIPAVILGLISLSLPACNRTEAQEQHQEQQKIVVTSPKAKDVTITQQYVCRILSKRHVNARALVDGYLEEILIKEGQAVKKGDVMFKILPVLYKARLDAELAEVQVAQIEYDQSVRLFKEKVPVVSQQDVNLHLAKLNKAKAKAQLAKAELDFATIRAPFNGIVDRLYEREGSLIKERDILTTVSDNSVMWVYFNVPEKNYLQYMSDMHEGKEIGQIELVLATGSKFQYAATGVTVEADFNIETGNIPFRGDFPNPHGLLRNGQTGTVLIHRTLPNAVVIPQRATFEILDKRYVWVVGADDVVHQRLIAIAHEQEDIFVIKSGLNVKDKIVLEGVREVREGEKVEFEFRPPEEVLDHQKNHAE